MVNVKYPKFGGRLIKERHLVKKRKKHGHDETHVYTNKIAETSKDRPSAIFGYIHAGGINSIFKHFPFEIPRTNI